MLEHGSKLGLLKEPRPGVIDMNARDVGALGDLPPAKPRKPVRKAQSPRRARGI